MSYSETNYENYQRKIKEQELKIKELFQYKTEFEASQKNVNRLEAEYEKLNKEKEYFELRNNEFEQQLKEKSSQIRSLKQKNDQLENEASKYQSALGIAVDLNLSEHDQNDSVQFNKDILALHDTLENYVTNLKPKIDVNVNEVKNLLLKYECQTKISDKEPNKPLIKAVLQRYVIEEILNQADFYFKRSGKDHNLESDIANQTTVLTRLMEKFYNNRFGNDEITCLAPIRLRQQVYTALGTRGFSDIRKSDSIYSRHNFIDIISKEINKIMNKYRNIRDIEKRKYVNTLAEDLVQSVVRIFYFRLLIQEPIAQYRWYKNGDKINKSCMKGSWDEDDVENMEVEVCSFPLILRPSSGDFKIFTPAKVFPRYITKQSAKEKIISKLERICTPNVNSIDEYESEPSLSDSGESEYHSTDTKCVIF